MLQHLNQSFDSNYEPSKVSHFLGRAVLVKILLVLAIYLLACPKCSPDYKKTNFSTCCFSLNLKFDFKFVLQKSPKVF